MCLNREISEARLLLPSPVWLKMQALADNNGGSGATGLPRKNVTSDELNAIRCDAYGGNDRKEEANKNACQARMKGMWWFRRKPGRMKDKAGLHAPRLSI